MRQLTLSSTYPAIAMAALVLAGWFLVAYKLNKRSVSSDFGIVQPTWYLMLIGPILAYGYFFGFDRPISTFLDLFFASLVGLCFAMMIVMAVNMALFSQDLDASGKRLYLIMALVLTILFTGAAFA